MAHPARRAPSYLEHHSHNLDKLQAFMDQHGHCEVPQGHELHYWLRDLRSGKSKGMDGEQRLRLNSLLAKSVSASTALKPAPGGKPVDRLLEIAQSPALTPELEAEKRRLLGKLRSKLNDGLLNQPALQRLQDAGITL